MALVIALRCVACAGAATPPGEPEDFTSQPPPLSTLRQRLETLEKKLAEGKAPQDSQNLSLLRFKLEQAHLWMALVSDSTYYYASSSQRSLAAVLQRAEAVAQATGDAAVVAKSQVHERAYLAAADGSVQPYWVFLPENYSPRRQYPLVVFLHGYDPNISKIEPWIPGETTWKLATGRGFILAVPYGRRNSDFVNIGEDDTVAVTNAVKKLYKVDENRVYLLGPSMGGYGVYAVGLHRPDIWAGLTPMAARSDFYLWFKLDPDTVPAWKRLLYDADDPRHLKENALHLPIFMQHGALDTIVDVRHSRLFSADLKALRYAVRYREIADGDHYIYWQASAYETALDWMNSSRRDPAPKRVVYTSGTLRNDRAFWVRLDAFEDYSHTAQIVADIGANSVIHVRTTNVAGFTLQPPRQHLAGGRMITLIVNGQMLDHTFDPLQPVVWKAAQLVQTGVAAEYPGTKSPARSGQIKNCYRDPFMLVYGTLQPAPQPQDEFADTVGDEAAARRFLHEWQRFADGEPPIKADKDVTAADRQQYNLILFGTRRSNSILREIADRLPMELTEDGYRIGTRVEVMHDLGLQFCYPSPFDASRMIVVQSGTYWGGNLPINHKFDLLPDFIVYTNTLDPSDGTNRAVVAGYFDGKWNLPTPLSPTTITPGTSTVPLATTGGSATETTRTH